MTETAGLHVHYFPNSHWSRVISLVLAEKGLTPERHFVDIRTGGSFDIEYIKLNPKGVVPTLVHNGNAVCNSPRIAEYLDTLAGPQLCFPENPEYVFWAKTLEDFPLMLMSYSMWVLGKRGERSDKILEEKLELALENAERYPEQRAFFERKHRFFTEFLAQLTDPGAVAREEERCAQILESMGALVETRPFILGDAYSFPDAIATSILYRLVDLGKIDSWYHAADSAVRRYYDRLLARPGFVAVFRDDPLIP